MVRADMQPYSNHAVCSTLALGHKVYVFGQQASLVYHVDTDSHVELTPPPLVPCFSSAVLVKGSIHVYGGMNSYRHVQKYDPATDTWSVEKNILPEGVWFHSSFLLPLGR
jgi:hypothetical protein